MAWELKVGGGGGGGLCGFRSVLVSWGEELGME